jgi:hypothetical protein
VATPAGQPLEALVRDELRGPVSELVRRVVVELVREQLNDGDTGAELREVPPSTNGATSSTKVCRRCGCEKPAEQFARNRRVCKPCRREQGRTWEEKRGARRKQAALDDDEEGPNPRPSPPTSSRRPSPTASSRRGYRLEAGLVARLREERRALIEAAEVELVERDGRIFALRRLPS